MPAVPLDTSAAILGNTLPIWIGAPYLSLTPRLMAVGNSELGEPGLGSHVSVCDGPPKKKT
jgi:hypothetical protein